MADPLITAAAFAAHDFLSTQHTAQRAAGAFNG